MIACKTIAIALAAFVLAGCAALTPPPPETSTADRLAVLETIPTPPFERAVEIYWDEFKVPHIAAQTQDDAAMALGLVHAHLRLGQMEFGKRVVSGRVSEMAGPLGAEIDKAILTIGFRRAVPTILANLPPETRAWLDAYVAGVNHYKTHLTTLPHDMRVLNMDNAEPWTAEDTLAIGRLGAADLNWSALFSLLPLRATPEWGRVWARFADLQGGKAPSFEVDDAIAPDAVESASIAEMPSWRELFDLTGPFARSGSNAFAVAASRSATGAPLIASDPHLAYTVPNLWLIAGVSWPGERIVGLMPAGVPIFVIGRNADLAWGATNMRQWSSDLVDVTGRSERRSERFETDPRAWFDGEIEVRTSEYGPILSDATLFPFPEGREVALRWMGHLPSDELTAYMGIATARRWEDLRDAMRRYSVPGQNLVFAEKQGDVGMILAAWLPNRPTVFPDDIFVTPEESDAAWSRILTTADLPVLVAPPDGVVASANNRPVDEPPTRISWFYPHDDRVRRIHDVLRSRADWSLAGLGDLQRDVYAISDHALAQSLAAKAQPLALDARERRVLDAMTAWDGHYTVESRGALVFHTWLTAIAPLLFDEAEQAWWWSSTHLVPQVKAALAQRAPTEIAQLLRNSLREAAETIPDEQVWGDIHRVDVQYILGRVPLLGGSYRYDDRPIAGGMETVAKASGPLDAERHAVTFGSQSRHLSDLSDENENYFILFGGQDGFLNAQNFTDQVDAWANGDYIRVPLDPAIAQTEALRTQRFSP